MTIAIKQIVNGEGDSQTIKMVVKDNERGPQGEQGEPGTPASITAGNAYTIDYGEQPQVMNTGSSSNAKFDFYIPEGKPGAIHYYAGPGINITEDNRIEATGEMAVYWGDLVGNISNQTDLKNILNKNMLSGIGSSPVTTSNTMSFTTTKTNIFSGANTTSSFAIPTATSTKAGIITADKYNEIGTNTTNIATKLSFANLTVDSTLNKTVSGSGTNTAIALGIASSGVNSSQIANSAVTTNKIADDAVTASKIDFGTLGFGNYSTSEQDTGFTWIDNKSIYKKTVYLNPFPDNASANFPHSISNLGTVVNIEGIATNNTTTTFPIPFVSRSAVTDQIEVQITSTDVFIYTGTNFWHDNNFFGYVTIYYTKSA